MSRSSPFTLLLLSLPLSLSSVRAPLPLQLDRGGCNLALDFRQLEELLFALGLRFDTRTIRKTGSPSKWTLCLGDNML